MIKDSGERREFDSGAVRGVQEGKGRCDLLPLEEVSFLCEKDIGILEGIFDFRDTGRVDLLYTVLETFCEENYSCIPDMILEVAKHFEDGCNKYGERNWEKGIPIHCYIDSAIRHYLKHLRGDTDERHDRALCWNVLCCIWTFNNKPELNDFTKGSL